MRSITGPLIKLVIFTVVTALLTGVLAMTVAATQSGTTTSYTAKFADASGIGTGDDVRMAGVKVGRVNSLRVDGKHALVEFELEGDRKIPRTTSAAVKFRNLAGQRYLALDGPLRDPADALRPEGTIPPERTKPALNLTELFNGFRPLFQALSPQDVNKLSFELIQVLQGQGGTVDSVLAHTASLTTTMAKKDEVIGQVIDNLNHVVGAVNSRSPQLSELITTLQHLVTGFAEQRQPIGESITALDDLTNTTEGMLREVRPPLKQDIAALNDLSKNLEDGLPVMEHDLKALPNRLTELTRTVSYGSWFNFYLCRFSGNVGIGKLGVEVPITPLPTTEMPERCQS